MPGSGVAAIWVIGLGWEKGAKKRENWRDGGVGERSTRKKFMDRPGPPTNFPL